jgi:CubicO group peptidase (beta-lactamase class C family)
MDWKLVAAVLGAGIVSSFTDWLFMGLLFRDRYQKYPETWWPRASQADEMRPILYSSALGFITAACVIGLCLFAGVSDLHGALVVALLAFAAGPLVVSLTTGIWMRIDPAVTFAHCLGYLARFLVAGIAAGLVLG